MSKSKSTYFLKSRDFQCPRCKGLQPGSTEFLTLSNDLTPLLCTGKVHVGFLEWASSGEYLISPLSYLCILSFRKHWLFILNCVTWLQFSTEVYSGFSVQNLKTIPVCSLHASRPFISIAAHCHRKALLSFSALFQHWDYLFQSILSNCSMK